MLYVCLCSFHLYPLSYPLTEEITEKETARINKIKTEEKMLIDSLQRDKVQVEKLVCDAENAKSRALKV